MIRNVEIINIDGETFISYYSEGDFEYSIGIGQRCKVILDKKCFVGTVSKINDNSFTLRYDEESVEIALTDICNLYGEDEIEI